MQRRLGSQLHVLDDQVDADGAIGSAVDSAASIDVDELISLAGKSAWSKGPVPYSDICVGVAKETKQDEKRVAQVRASVLGVGAAGRWRVGALGAGASQ